MSAPLETRQRHGARLANPRRFVVIMVILLAAVTGLLFWARPLIRELIVLPLSYLFWAVGIFFRNTPERFFWAVLLLITGLAAFRSLFKRSMPLADVPLDIPESAYHRPFSGQVSLWHLRVESMGRSQSNYLRSTFEQAVGKLLFDTLSHRYHLSQSEVERRLREDSLDVPAPVREYALNSLRRLDSVQSIGYQAYLRGLLRQAWKGIQDLIEAAAGPRKGDRKAMDPSLARQIERLEYVLSYIEKDLEVPNDDSGQ